MDKQLEASILEVGCFLTFDGVPGFACCSTVCTRCDGTWELLRIDVSLIEAVLSNGKMVFEKCQAGK